VTSASAGSSWRPGVLRSGCRGEDLHVLQSLFEFPLAQVQFGVGVGATTAVGTAVIMVSGGFQALEGEITVGTLLVFLSYLNSLYTPVENLAYLSSGFASAAGRARRVFDLFDADEMEAEARADEPLALSDFDSRARAPQAEEQQAPDDLAAMRRAAQEIRAFDPSPLMPKRVAETKGKTPETWTLRAVLERAWQLGTSKEA